MISNTLHKIRITKNGPDGVWYNSRIGQEFSGFYRRKTDNPLIRGYLIHDCWFIPEECCTKLSSHPKTYKRNGRDHPVSVTNVNTGEMFIFNSITDASKHFRISISTLSGSLMSGIPAFKTFLIKSNKY